MKTSRLLATLATLLVPASAGADAGDDIHKHGLEVSVGGGLTLFNEVAPAEESMPGSNWEARVGFGTKTRLAIELAYVGAFQGIPANPNLLGTGIEGNLRVNLLRGNVRPYLLAGVGWSHYNRVTSRPDMSIVGDNDETAAFPMGFGVGVHLGQITLDLRAVYRKTAAVDMFESMDSKSATFRAGFEY